MTDLTLKNNPLLKNMVTGSWLVRIPVLGYFFRKIAENLAALERTLKQGKETKGETRKRSFLCGLLGMSSDKKFNVLSSRKKVKKRKTWSKLRPE